MISLTRLMTFDLLFFDSLMPLGEALPNLYVKCYLANLRAWFPYFDFFTHEFVIEESVVERDLLKIWSFFREMDI